MSPSRARVRARRAPISSSQKRLIEREHSLLSAIDRENGNRAVPDALADRNKP
ncbi:hypothetical protein [Streptomyces sp. SYP-A7185]|uniref:hypothetical protein n=1 Tax=Streptomyces sp. SYP-A7185 TaxID=3040076 RepID=UPI0038F6EE12